MTYSTQLLKFVSLVTVIGLMHLPLTSWAKRPDSPGPPWSPTVGNMAGATSSSDASIQVLNETNAPLAPLDTVIASRSVQAPYNESSRHYVHVTMRVQEVNTGDIFVCQLRRSDGERTVPNGRTPQMDLQVHNVGLGAPPNLANIPFSLHGLWPGTTNLVTYNLYCGIGPNPGEVWVRDIFLTVIVVPNDFTPEQP